MSSTPTLTLAYALDGTCLYVRLPSGVEVFNSTAYTSPALAAAQRACAERYGIVALGTLFVDNAPLRVGAEALVRLAVAEHVFSVFTRSVENAQNVQKVVDAEFVSI